MLNSLNNKYLQTVFATLKRNFWSTLFVVGIVIMAYTGIVQDMLPTWARLETERCVEKLGCFSIEGNWSHRIFNALPEHPVDIGTEYIVYSQTGQIEQFSPTDLDELMGEINPKKSVIIVIHGWISSRTDHAIKPLMDALVTNIDANILLVEWTRGSTNRYPLAAANTRVVGAQVSLLLNHISEFSGVSLTNTHIIGISLGAHIAGYAGSRVKGLGRITALDAAGPLFEDYPPSMRLDPSDADFVDAVHTDGDDFVRVIIAEGGLGVHHPIGHADFYPNGGHTQPHCSGVIARTLSNLPDLGLSSVRKMVACDHEVSIDYFIQSLQGLTYIAFTCENGHEGFLRGKCQDTNTMGYKAIKPAHPASYYLHMSDFHPFEGYHYPAVLHLDGLRGVTGLVEVTASGEKGSAFSLDTGSEPRLLDGEQTAMLFSQQDVGSIMSLHILLKLSASESENFRSQSNSLLLNATLDQSDTRLYSCTKVKIDFSNKVEVKLQKTCS